MGNGEWGMGNGAKLLRVVPADAGIQRLAGRLSNDDRRAFVETEGEVEVLHGLRRGALEQVVERRDHDDALAPGCEREATDLHVMLVGDPAHPRRILDDADE